jgi:hypothetical protein
MVKRSPPWGAAPEDAGIRDGAAPSAGPSPDIKERGQAYVKKLTQPVLRGICANENFGVQCPQAVRPRGTMFTLGVRPSMNAHYGSHPVGPMVLEGKSGGIAGPRRGR